MKQTFAALLIGSFIFSLGCSQQSKEKKKDNTEKGLYDQVMEVHDEVMPSMSELYMLKRDLAKKIENSSDLVEAKKKQIEGTILLLDSASRGMMRWMNEFSPEDYSGKDLDEYLEGEMKRVQLVKATILDALDKGRKENQ